MNIYVVGNILKDTYLNLDTRTERIEPDKYGTDWLDIAFNASEHHFFSSTTSMGGAAITKEVLSNMGLTATVCDPSSYTTSRYILVANGKASYFAPSKFTNTTFTPPHAKIDYLYVDRSAYLTPSACTNIINFLHSSPSTKFILYLKDSTSPHINSLIPHAHLVFVENRGKAEPTYALPSAQTHPDRTIYISEDTLQYQHITQKFTPQRIDISTHLSIYSILSATVLGSIILGNSVEKSFAMARANAELSTLTSTLSLSKLQDAANLPPHTNEIELIAANLMLPGKGILAADESGGSIKKKFAKLHIPDTTANRRDYRNILLSTPHLNKYVNGVILFDETTRQFADNGQNFVDYLTSCGIIPGIKVDQGLEKFANSEETYTKGLDGLHTKAREYYLRGLRFAKWRAAFTIRSSDAGAILPPSRQAIDENCRTLAKYAKICQDAGLVPIVEPELIYDGYYTIEQSALVTGHILSALFIQLQNCGVNLRACILKVNMIMDGKQYKISTPTEVGKATAAVLKARVPAELAGVVFLSGGQEVKQATANLAAIVHEGPYPWPVSFSFARALQDPALEAWQGDNANTNKAKEAFVARLVANTDALKNSP